jgi:hypothetical protein
MWRGAETGRGAKAMGLPAQRWDWGHVLCVSGKGDLVALQLWRSQNKTCYNPRKPRSPPVWRPSAWQGPPTSEGHDQGPPHPWQETSPCQGLLESERVREKVQKDREGGLSKARDTLPSPPSRSQAINSWQMGEGMKRTELNFGLSLSQVFK